MRFHILNGDALAEKFPPELEGERIIWREAFIEGYQELDTDDNFWKKRMDYVGNVYGATIEEYSQKFLSQVKRLMEIKKDEVYLWFEDDLFCQTNMWWVIKMIWMFRQPTQVPMPTLYRVFPENKPGTWDGFGKATSADLISLYHKAVRFKKPDIDVALKLWNDYQHGYTLQLEESEIIGSHCFRYLPEVIKAQNDRNPVSGPGRPQQILENIIDEGKASFEEIFAEFYKRAGVYGFGDVQVRNMLKAMGLITSP